VNDADLRFRRRLLILLVADGALGATRATPGTQPMSPSPSASPSLLQRATHLLHIRIEHSRADPWQTGEGGWDERNVHVEAQLVEVLKGAVDSRSSTRLLAQVLQRRNPSLMFMPVPGIWSAIALDPRADLVVFASSGEASPAALHLLREPPAFAVVESASELPGIRLALRHAAGELGTAAMLQAAAGVPLGNSFVDYLAAILPTPAFAAPDAYRALLALVSVAHAETAVQAGLIAAVVNGVPRNPAFGEREFNRMVAALLQFGIGGRAMSLQENLLTIDVPALVGLRGGEARTAAAVFDGDAPTRSALLKALRERPQTPGADLLVPWLAAP
jgi:hypothetical protein